AWSPHTDKAWPEMFRPEGDTRKRAISAMSCELTMRRNDIGDTKRSRTSSTLTPSAFALALITRSARSPSTAPGRIALTRMFDGPSSIARLFVKPIPPHLAEEYGVRKGYPNRPAIDDRLMMLPPPAALSNGTARRVQ